MKLNIIIVKGSGYLLRLYQLFFLLRFIIKQENHKTLTIETGKRVIEISNIAFQRIII